MEPNNLTILQKCKQVLVHPSALFEAVKDEEGVGPAFKYLAVFSLVLAVGSISYLFFTPLSELPMGIPWMNTAEYLGVAAIMIAPIIYVSNLLGTFLGAGWLHIFAKLLRGKGNYSATYKAIVYADTPSLLFGWIPIAGAIISLYSIYLTLVGISKLHEISMARAIGIIIISVAVIIVPVIIIIVLVIGVIGMDLTSFLVITR